MRRTWAAVVATMMATGLGARASQAQPAPSGAAAPATAPVPTVVGNAVVIPVPSASATVAGPSATVAAPPPMLMVPQPAGAASGQVPNGYVMLVPWTPPPAATAPAPMIAPEPAVTERSYARKLVIADLSALGLLALSLPAQSEELAGVAVGVYALGSPVMHLTEGNGGRALASFGLRVGGPVLVTGAAYGLFCTGDNSDFDSAIGCALGVTFGFLGSIGGAIGIDYVILGKETVPAANPAPRSVSWSPTFKPSKDGMTLGVVGAW